MERLFLTTLYIPAIYPDLSGGAWGRNIVYAVVSLIYSPVLPDYILPTTY